MYVSIVKNYRERFIRFLRRASTASDGIQELVRSALRIRSSSSRIDSGVESSMKSMMSSSIFLDNVRAGASIPRNVSLLIIVSNVFDMMV